MLWLLVVEREIVTEPRAVARGFRVLIKGPVATARGSVTHAITKLKQSPLNLHHPAHAFNRGRGRRDCHSKLITEQVLDVINQQFLMLHLVFETEPHNRKDRLGIIAIRHTFNKSRHLFIDVGAIPQRLFHRRPRTGATFRSRHTRPKSFVIRVEVKEKVFGVDSISRLELLQHRFKEP